MKITDFYSMGKITRPHGLKGALTLALGPEAPDDLGTLDVLYVDRDGHLVPYFIETISVKGVKAYIKFQDVDTHDQASALGGLDVLLPKASRPARGESEFYYDELVGFAVHERDDHALGVVTDVMQSGLQRLLVVSHAEKEILIPITGPFIQKVDRAQRVIFVELPDGFLDI